MTIKYLLGGKCDMKNIRKCNVYDVQIICDDIVQLHMVVKSLWDLETFYLQNWLMFGGDIDVDLIVKQISGTKCYPQILVV